MNGGSYVGTTQWAAAVSTPQSPAPKGLVTIVPEASDPRTYRVSFDRIERLWGFRASKRVGDGIEEVARALRAGTIPNPEDPRYVNA